MRSAPRIVHKGSAVAKNHVYPLGSVVRISSNASGLVQDARNAACSFGQATEAKDIEAKYEIMQMRVHDLAYYVSQLELHFRTPRNATMKF